MTKKILCIGDSICEGVGTLEGNHSYVYYLQQLHPDFNVINLGVGGMTISKKDETVVNCIPDRIASKEFEKPEYDNPDIILFEGGINDMMRNVVLGYNKNSYLEPKLYSTFCDALDYMFYYFKSRFPKARMIFTSIHLIANSTSEYVQRVWWDCTSEVCAKWGVEYINLFRHVNAHFVDKLQLHPNEVVHELYYTPIIDKVICGAYQSPSTSTDYSLKNRVMEAYFHSGTKIFEVGSSVSTSDWRINAVRTDRRTYSTISSSCSFDTSDVDSSKVGSYPVHVYFVDNGKSDNFDVYVNIISNGDKVLDKITATKNQTSSNIGIIVDNSDIVVTASYTDGSTADVSSLVNIDNTNVNTSICGKYSILITYEEDDKTVNTSIEYTITEEKPTEPIVIDNDGEWDDEIVITKAWATLNTFQNTNLGKFVSGNSYIVRFTAICEKDTSDNASLFFRLSNGAKVEIDKSTNYSEEFEVAFFIECTNTITVSMSAYTPGGKIFPWIVKIKDLTVETN